VDLDVSRDNSQFASCGNEKSAYVWDVSKCTVVRKFWEHDLNLTAVKFSLDASVLLTGSNDRFVRIFDCRSRNNTPIQKLGGFVDMNLSISHRLSYHTHTHDRFKDGVTSLCTNAHQIIAGSVDGTIRTFDIRQGEVHIDKFEESVTCVSLSRDGKCVLASTLGSRLHLYEASNGKDLNSYTGHTSSKFKIASCLSNTESHVLSGSEDGSIYIWGLVDGKLEQKLTPSRTDSSSSMISSKKAICDLAYHPTKKCLLSCGHDGTASLWVATS